jgi:hypothetical protein
MISNQPIEPEILPVTLYLEITKLALDDALWLPFKYKHRPKHGLFFNRFRSKQKVLFEDFLFREFIIIGMAESTRAIHKCVEHNFPESLIASVYELLVDGLPDIPPNWENLNFPSRQECAKYLFKGLALYLSQSQNDEHLAFTERLELSGCDPSPQTRFGYVIMFTQQIPRLRELLEKHVTSVSVTQEMPVSDPIFLRTAAEIISLLKKDDSVNQSN